MSASKTASAPFNDTGADLILRTSDNVNFRVFKIILSLASPVFADMIKTSHPAIVVTISEDSKALDLVLRHLYPVKSPTSTGVELHDACILAEFARKYRVEGLDFVISRYVTDAIETDPVGAYAIAVTYGHKGIGARAARSTLKLPVSRLQSPHLQFTTAELYEALIQYHTACGAAASDVASERGWFSRNKAISTAHQGTDLSCSSCSTLDFIGGLLDQTPPLSSVQRNSSSRRSVSSSIGPRYGPRCLWNYLLRSAFMLAHHPTAEAVTAEDFVLKSLNCLNCPSGTRKGLLEFSQIFGTEIKKAVEQVPLPKGVQP
ncbi:hypothetical protein BJV78DRAFT_572608 [Lactifluus subvellereus]|nr:hypothetical protein BJV78DRAFT_572608 [Lactifluus subvellereus]